MSLFTNIGPSRRMMPKRMSRRMMSRSMMPGGRSWPRSMQMARGKAAHTAERFGPASRRARRVAGERMMDARQWTAPQLHRAAGYVEQDLGPRLSAMLAATARRVEPPRRGRRIRTTALVVVGAIGAIGIAGALLTRYKLTSSSYDEGVEEAEAGSETMPHHAPSEVSDSADRFKPSSV